MIRKQVISLTHAGYSAVAKPGSVRAAVLGCYKEAPGHRSVWHHIPPGPFPGQSLREQIC